MIPSRRLEDQIQELCTRVAKAKRPDELSLALSKLQSAIHEYTDRTRTRFSAILVGRPDYTQERRNGGLSIPAKKAA